MFNLLWNKKVKETINSPQLCGHRTLKYLPNHSSHSRDTAAVFTQTTLPNYRRANCRNNIMMAL